MVFKPFKKNERGIRVGNSIFFYLAPLNMVQSCSANAAFQRAWLFLSADNFGRTLDFSKTPFLEAS